MVSTDAAAKILDFSDGKKTFNMAASSILILKSLENERQMYHLNFLLN